MSTDKPNTLPYKRARFVTFLPTDYRYSPSHYWMWAQPDGLWRVGLTQFATRLLGEMVDYALEVKAGDRVQSGQILGWIEGFKAISDIYCIGEGSFAQANPALAERITLVNQDPYGACWIYAVQGDSDATCLDVHGYTHILDKTIDRMLEKQRRGKVR